MKTSLDEKFLGDVLAGLKKENTAHTTVFPGDSAEQQPIHTLYGGAHLFKAETAQKIGELAIKHLKQNAPNHKIYAEALEMGGDDKLHRTVYERVEARLRSCAVEDFRIDFEDGYGNRPDKEEDETAATAAKEVARGMKENILPPHIGIRIKPLNEELKARSIRTLDVFLTTLMEASGGKIPKNFVITLPKVFISEQMGALDQVLSQLEKKFGLPNRTFKIEIMIELAQAIIDRHGHCPIPEMVDAGGGRCRGAHFGTYDFTASCDITAAFQKMDHPSCIYALNVMKMALAGRGIWLSDGATSIMPVALHRGENLGAADQQANLRAVHRAWKLSYDNVMRSLGNGYYQGWDLHPGQLSVRYAACYAFFLETLQQASTRLKNFIDKAAQATLVGDVFDDAATGQGLLNYFLRALNSGAITEEEVDQTGLTIEEVRSKSFVAIVRNRVKQ